jgi:hypothetical protein
MFDLRSIRATAGRRSGDSGPYLLFFHNNFLTR